MNRGQKKYLLPIGLFCLLLSPVCFIQNLYADELDRLFLTKADRKMLDELRYTQPKDTETIKIVIEDIIEDESHEPELGGITVNGLVYRKGGKNTAWINNTNTFEGGLGNQYIQINVDDINPESIQIQISGSVTDIKLKVGETYDTATEKVIDLTDTFTGH